MMTLREPRRTYTGGHGEGVSGDRHLNSGTPTFTSSTSVYVLCLLVVWASSACLHPHFVFPLPLPCYLAATEKTQNALNLADMRHGLAAEELEVGEIFVTKGKVQKRIRIMGRGRAGIARWELMFGLAIYLPTYLRLPRGRRYSLFWRAAAKRQFRRVCRSTDEEARLGGETTAFFSVAKQHYSVPHYWCGYFLVLKHSFTLLRFVLLSAAFRVDR